MLPLLIDAREAYRARPTGKGYFGRSLIEELMRREIPPTLLLEKGQRSPGRSIAFPAGPLWHFHAARFLKKQGEMYLSPASFLVPALLGTNVPFSLVIHDLIAFHEEPHDRKAKILERLTLKRSLKRATLIFCVSEATKKELLERFPWVDARRITIIYEGPTLKRPGTYHLTPNTFSYILSIGTLCPRKNQLRLIRAFTLLPEKLKHETKLILVGPRGWHDAEIVALAKKTPNVEWRGYVSNAEREKLLRNATAFAYPSIAEGFGLPVLDALMLGIPTVTSNCSSLPEVAGAAALLIDPRSTEEIAHGLERLLTDEKLREELRRKGPLQAAKFSWERTVDVMLRIMQIQTPHPRPLPEGEGKNKTSPLPGGEG